MERDLATPENLLAVAALSALLKALRGLPARVLPSGASPERRAVDRLRAELSRVERMPLPADLRKPAQEVLRTRPLSVQRAGLLRRIERGDLPRPAPYRRLADWVADFLTGAGPSPGGRLWAFYDERFDPRLFEIWTVTVLSSCLTARFGQPDGGLVPLWDRDKGPIGRWSTPYGLLELFFQREVATLGVAGRWEFPSRHRRLRALPDIMVKAQPAGEGERWFLIDCKLRRHQPIPSDPGHEADLPSEEIY